MRLIDADLLKAKVPNTNVDIFENCRNCRTLMDWEVKELIDKMPTIDAVEVVHGRDIYQEAKGHCEFKCSVCGAEIGVVEGGDLDGGKFNYCPNCGASMDGKEQNDENQQHKIEH